MMNKTNLIETRDTAGDGVRERWGLMGKKQNEK
jgi:hypothetical protein